MSISMRILLYIIQILDFYFKRCFFYDYRRLKRFTSALIFFDSKLSSRVQSYQRGGDMFSAFIIKFIWFKFK